LQGLESQKKIEKSRQRLLEKEEKELTFHPQLNTNTDKILDKMIKEGRAPRSKTKKTGTAEDPGRICCALLCLHFSPSHYYIICHLLDFCNKLGHGEEVFSPKILSRSDNVKTEHPDVYKRLYTEAKRCAAKKNQNMSKLYEDKVNVEMIKAATG
jgi:hypothetical protein